MPEGRGPGFGLAIAAVAVALTTPLWYDSALRLLGIIPTLQRAQLEDALSISRLERKAQDTDRQLGATTGQVARTRDDLARVERAQRDAEFWARALILSRLADATRTGRPFTGELSAARQAATDDVASLITRIAPYAAIGVPTPAELMRDFRRVTDPVLRPARGLNPIAWASAAYALLPFGRSATDTDPARALLREAAALVDAGRPFEAADRLRPVRGPVGELMAGWIADVDARLVADALLRRVDALIVNGRR